MVSGGASGLSKWSVCPWRRQWKVFAPQSGAETRTAMSPPAGLDTDKGDKDPRKPPPPTTNAKQGDLLTKHSVHTEL